MPFPATAGLVWSSCKLQKFDKTTKFHGLMWYLQFARYICFYNQQYLCWISEYLNIYQSWGLDPFAETAFLLTWARASEPDETAESIYPGLIQMNSLHFPSEENNSISSHFPLIKKNSIEKISIQINFQKRLSKEVRMNASKLDTLGMGWQSGLPNMLYNYMSPNKD